MPAQQDIVVPLGRELKPPPGRLPLPFVLVIAVSRDPRCVISDPRVATGRCPSVNDAPFGSPLSTCGPLLRDDALQQPARGEHVLAGERASAAAEPARMAAMIARCSRSLASYSESSSCASAGAQTAEPEKRAPLASRSTRRHAGDGIDHVVEGVVGAHPLADEVATAIRRIGPARAPRSAARTGHRRRPAGRARPRRSADCDLGRQALELGTDEERLAQARRARPCGRGRRGSARRNELSAASRATPRTGYG